MRRASRHVLTQVAVNALYLPRAISVLRDWLPYTLDYLAYRFGIHRPPRSYTLRNGASIMLQSPIHTMILGEVFLKRDYGTVNAGAVVIDVGAHIGLFAIYAATGARGVRVYAYEPVPDNLQLLRRNIDRNHLAERVTWEALGLAGTRGYRRLYLFQHDVRHSMYPSLPLHAAPRGSIAVECITLQDVFERHGLQRCDLLKIDCEGAEYECVYSTPPEVLSRIGAIRLEYHLGVPDTPWGTSSAPALAQFLEQGGFRITRLQDTGPGQGLLWAENRRLAKP